MDEKQKRIRWKTRRKVVIYSLLFCAGTIAYLLLKGTDTELNRSIANGTLLLAGSIITSYVFGATWDDKNKKSDE